MRNTPAPYIIGGTASGRSSQALTETTVGQKRPLRTDSALSNFQPSFTGLKRQRIDTRAPPNSMGRGFFSRPNQSGNGTNVTYIQDKGAAGSHGAANSIVTSAIISCERSGEAGPGMAPGDIQMVRNLRTPGHRGGASRSTLVSARSLLEVNAYLRSSEEVVPRKGTRLLARNERSDYVAPQENHRSVAPKNVFGGGRSRVPDKISRRRYVSDFAFVGVHLSSKRGTAARGWEKGVSSVTLSGPAEMQNLFFYGDGAKGIQAGDVLWLIATWLPEDESMRAKALEKFSTDSRVERFANASDAVDYEGYPGRWQIIPYATRTGKQPPRSLYIDPKGLFEGHVIARIGKVVRVQPQEGRYTGNSPQNRELATRLLFSKMHNRGSEALKLRKILVSVKP